jgi:choline dehydrogenase
MTVVDRIPKLVRSAPRRDAYDYVVVGAGAAGSVVASQLADDRDTTVLLVDAASSRAYPRALETEPELALDRRRIPWTSPPANHIPPAPAALAAWDVPGWPAAAFTAPAPAPTTHEAQDALTHAFVASARQFGLAANPAFTNGATGVSAGSPTSHSGHRRALPTMFRPNLTVRTRTPVLRIVLHGTRAHGVAIRAHNAESIIEARREVILCAGAAETPKLLMLSGVGPGSRLHACGIDVAADLPGVGESLADPLEAALTFEHVGPTPGRLSALLHRSRRGHRTATAFIPLGARGSLNHFQLAFEPHAGRDRFVIRVAHLFPRSRGFVTLRGRDPGLAPLIRANYLWEDDDLDNLVTAVELVRDLAAQLAFEPYRGDELVPGPGVQSPAALALAIRATAVSAGAPTGTCRIGTDALAVVDSQLRVRGIDGLRVVGGCVMPASPGAISPTATAILAHRAAALITGRARIEPAPVTAPGPLTP